MAKKKTTVDERLQRAQLMDCIRAGQTIKFGKPKSQLLRVSDTPLFQSDNQKKLW